MSRLRANWRVGKARKAKAATMAKAPTKSGKKSAEKSAKKETRTILITGGSRGLGLGIARKLVANGYDVIAVARSDNKELAAAIAEAKRAKLGALHFVPFDLGEITKIPDLVRDLRKEFGPLFGLVNNAALGHDGALSLMHNSRIEELVRINTLSP